MPRRVYCAIAFVLCLLGMAPTSHAYPWMNKHGYSACSPCHQDPSGGELLTEYGRVMSDAFLSAQFGGDADFDAQSEESESADAPARPAYEPFWGVAPLPDSLLLGGSVRLASVLRPSQEDDTLRAFPMQLDLYGGWNAGEHLVLGGSLGVAKVPAKSPHARAAQITGNQEDGYNLISRTHYVGWRFGGGSGQVRLGRLNLPYGIRLSEHTLWTREHTQTDRESDQQHGIALYMEFERGRFELMAIAGNYQVSPDRLRERGYAGYTEWYPWDGVALGASTLFTVAQDDRLQPALKRNIRHANGVTLRLALNEALVVLAEGNLLFRSRRNPGYVGFAQIDAELWRGLHLIGTAEVLDAGSDEKDRAADAPGFGEAKTGAWLGAQWFFATHFDVRLDAIVRQDEPFQLLGQLHVYL